MKDVHYSKHLFKLNLVKTMIFCLVVLNLQSCIQLESESNSSNSGIQNNELEIKSNGLKLLRYSNVEAEKFIKQYPSLIELGLNLLPLRCRMQFGSSYLHILQGTFR